MTDSVQYLQNMNFQQHRIDELIQQDSNQKKLQNCEVVKYFMTEKFTKQTER